MVINSTFCILTVSLISIIIMTIYLLKFDNKNKLHKYFIFLNFTLIIHTLSLMLQILFSNKSIEPIYFDYITYLGASFTPICILLIALVYSKKEKYIKYIRLLFVIPVIFLILLWTNDYHHMFYENYSVYLNKTVYGPFLILYALYSYSTFIISVVMIITESINISGFFSKQTVLILFGFLIPVVCNLIGLLKIIPITIYVMPIAFVIFSILASLAIFKYKALNITPVALETVTDTMSDSFIVISDDGTIADTNLTFRKTFGSVMDFNKDKNLFEVIEQKKLIDVAKLKDIIKKTRKNDTIVNVEYHLNYNKKEKFFEVDIHPIKAKKDKNQYIGTLLLFKDITQHKKDIKEIEEKQEIIVKQGQLVSIGELAGGVAHDINTPISAIKTGITMLNQKQDRDESEKEILQRMENCANKIINIVNSMRNQIRNLGGTTKVKFKISDVINDIKVITFHEVYKNQSEFIVNIMDDLSVQGDPTKLGQVLTNLVVNAVQAYGEKGGKVEVIVEKAPKNKAIIKVIDYAGGLDPQIKPFVFKNILTTKGTFGTGLGLYLAYSIIKGEFNGEINFESEKGMGTTFYITIPSV